MNQSNLIILVLSLSLVLTKLKKIYQKAAYILDEEEVVIIRDFVESSHIPHPCRNCGLFIFANNGKISIWQTGFPAVANPARMPRESLSGERAAANCWEIKVLTTPASRRDGG